jgi:NADH-quinone oxidoreductase subunit G
LSHLHADNADGVPPQVSAVLLSNTCKLPVVSDARTTAEPCVAGIYQLDSIVRRASSLQLTADGRAGAKSVPEVVS